MKSPLIVGFYGEQGVGKSTLAAQLRPLGFEVFPFAGVLKEMSAVLEQYMNPVGKNEDCPHLGFSPRKLQQVLGTEVGRSLNKDLWLRIMERRINGYPRVVIDDVRFDNERDWILQNNGILVRIQSDEFKSEQKSNHRSEVDWHKWTDPHFTWTNSSFGDITIGQILGEYL